MACWIHPVSGKGGGQECSVLSQDRAAGCSPRRAAPSLELRSRERRWWQSKSCLGSPRSGSWFTIRTLWHCGVLPAASAWIASSLWFLPWSDRKAKVDGVFQFFSNVFFKKIENCINFTRMTTVVLFLAG